MPAPAAPSVQQSKSQIMGKKTIIHLNQKNMGQKQEFIIKGGGGSGNGGRDGGGGGGGGGGDNNKDNNGRDGRKIS